MKNIFFLLFILVLFSIQSCTKPKPLETPIAATIPVPQLVMDYFVNDEVGTCWVYQDSINPTNFDTIELTRILPTGTVIDSGILLKSYVVFYKPHKTEEFRVWVTAGKENLCNIQILPAVSGNGNLYAGERDSNWFGGVYGDSMRIMDKTNYQTLEIYQYNVANFFDFIYAKNIGLVSYQSWGLRGVKGTGGCYKFVKKFKK